MLQSGGQAFEEAVSELGRVVVQRVVTSPRFFAIGQKQVNTSDYSLKLYALAQCSPDLKAEECDVCRASGHRRLARGADDFF